MVVAPGLVRLKAVLWWYNNTIWFAFVPREFLYSPQIPSVIRACYSEIRWHFWHCCKLYLRSAAIQYYCIPEYVRRTLGPKRNKDPEPLGEFHHVTIVLIHLELCEAALDRTFASRMICYTTSTIKDGSSSSIMLRCTGRVCSFKSFWARLISTAGDDHVFDNSMAGNGVVNVPWSFTRSR